MGYNENSRDDNHPSLGRLALLVTVTGLITLAAGYYVYQIGVEQGRKLERAEIKYQMQIQNEH